MAPGRSGTSTERSGLESRCRSLDRFPGGGATDPLSPTSCKEVFKGGGHDAQIDSAVGACAGTWPMGGFDLRGGKGEAGDLCGQPGASLGDAEPAGREQAL